MTADELRLVVQKFADRPVDVALGGRSLLAEVHGQLIEVDLRQKGGLLYCTEAGREEPAEQWIIRRLGNLEILANRILEFVPGDEALIPVRADVTGVVDLEDGGNTQGAEDLVGLLPEIIDALPAASTNIMYLTSDAGEGKTCVLEALARAQARSFLDRRSDWLFLPIGLAGRPFMRLDEVIVAALANQFRFRYLYYEALLELVKRKAVVLGLDGFEEMFIESQTGEVASSLGNLVARLDSQGTLVFAARKAYYRYSNLESQAKLFKSIRDMNVAFGEARLRRWTRDQFVLCCERYGLTTAESNTVYEAFTDKLPADHPVLTRAVLARRAIKEVADAGCELDLPDVLGNGDTSPESVFERFVEALIHREATEKWIDRTGEAAAPLLSPQEHGTILMALAEEMWLGGTEYLAWDVMEAATEVVVDGMGKGPSTLRQAKERIRQHALLQKAGAGDAYAFDHEEFRAYFLGCRLGHLLNELRAADVRRILSAQILPELAVRVAARKTLAEPGNASLVVELLQEVSSFGPKSSFGRINSAVLLVRIISGAGLSGLTLRDMYFPANSVAGSQLSGICFDSCIFDSISFSGDPVAGVEFRASTIIELVSRPDARGHSGVFDAVSLPEVIRTGIEDDANALYSPDAKRVILRSMGFTVAGEDIPAAPPSELEMDERIADVDKVVRAFRKATQVNENILALRLGARWSDFERNCLEEIIHRGVLVEVKYKGHGHQRRYKLGVGFDDVERARRSCGGQYEAFLDELCGPGGEQ